MFLVFSSKSWGFLRNSQLYILLGFSCISSLFNIKGLTCAVSTSLKGSKSRQVIGIIPTLNDHNVVVVDYFIPSTYVDAKGETRKCYECTKMGCDILANKMTGDSPLSFDHLPILGMWNLNEVWAVNRKIRFAKLYYELSCGELSRGEHSYGEYSNIMAWVLKIYMVNI